MKYLSHIHTAFSVLALLWVVSCSEKGGFPADVPGDSGIPVRFVPALDWGASKESVMASQDGRYLLEISSDTLLRYADETDHVTVDYKFMEGKLVCSSLTQRKLSSLADAASVWLAGYDRQLESETATVCTSPDRSSLAYGRLLRGSDCSYVSVAWTYLDQEEGNLPDGPDFSASGRENGYDYVDLGTGVGWATCNLMASSPDQPGSYYMWGETYARSQCWWSNYSLYHGSGSYLDEDAFSTPSQDISGSSYDAVSKNMGGGWRMPDRSEFYALINNCSLEVGEYNGTAGFIVTGPSGKSIFLPASGRKKKDEVDLTNTVYLWSSTASGTSNAYYLDYKTKNLDASGIKTMGRYYGMPMRGVVDLQ